jgi:hypothetical protein
MRLHHIHWITYGIASEHEMRQRAALMRWLEEGGAKVAAWQREWQVRW